MAITATRNKHDDILRATDASVTGADLVALAGSRDVGVKAAVAARRDCPMASLISLSFETDRRILEALVGNPSTPDRIVRDLAAHKRASIRDAALLRLGLVRVR